MATVTYGNGTKTLYTYNDAGWVTAIRHEKADQSLILLLGYGYSADGLITTISEFGGPGGWATTTFTYDNRNRLVLESRDGLGLYGFGYTYDQGGNRLTKTDYFNSLLTTYHYDLENPQYYQSKNNRLMYYEVERVTVPESPVLVEKVYYQYSIDRTAVGNPDMIVHEAYTSGVPVSYAATDLQYNMQGELWFVTERHWQAGDVWCANQVRDRITEFRGNGRARYMARQRNPYLDEYGGSEWQVLPETAVWSDYDGDEIYGDYVIDPTTGALTNRTAYLPGVGQMDSQTGAVTYYHADHLGTLRATTDGAGLVSSGLVLTAFGETVAVDGTVGTRYQYAGVWGYESGLGSPGQGGSTGQSALPWQHVGHRWYEPATGRFLQRDPVGIYGGLNVYEYVGNRPTSGVDPNGLTTWLTDWGEGCQSAGNIAIGVGCAITLYGTVCAGPPTLGGSVPPSVVAGGGLALIGGVTVGIGEVLIQLDKIPPSPPWTPPRWPPEPEWYCFVAGTVVCTVDGLVPIQDIMAGDWVCGYDEGQEAIVVGRVTACSGGEAHELIIVRAGGEEYRCTAEHPFYTWGRGWVLAGGLRAGDALRTMDDSAVPVEDCDRTEVEDSVRVYTVSVEGCHTFYVGHQGILVHNKP